MGPGSIVEGDGYGRVGAARAMVGGGGGWGGCTTCSQCVTVELKARTDGCARHSNGEGHPTATCIAQFVDVSKCRAGRVVKATGLVEHRHTIRKSDKNLQEGVWPLKRLVGDEMDVWRTGRGATLERDCREWARGWE